MTTYLERYQNGEREQVWAELAAAGIQVRQEPLFSDAWAVACETMTRARKNVDLLVERLSQIGYQFEAQEVFRKPQPGIARRIAEFEQEVGPIPLSLRAWLEIVGEVNFIGSYPGLSYYGPSFSPDFAHLIEEIETKEFQETAQKYGFPAINPLWLGFLKGEIAKERQKRGAESSQDKGPEAVVYADPLVVANDLSIDWYRAWQEDQQENGYLEDEPFCAHIAPDTCLKSNFSGGGGYAIALPNLAADAPLLNEDHHTTFVGYLRISFAWGGFPGLEKYANRNDEILRFLKEGLLPI